VKGVLRVIDHSAIYLAIAGTYTPFVLVGLRGAWRWTLLGVVWGAAAAGIAIAATISRRLGALRVAISVAMGWVGIVAFRPLLASLGTGGMGLVIGGGLVYTLGVAVYAWRGLPITTRSGTPSCSAGAPCTSSRCSGT
jgi:hemolysin III